jgi:hypothetical protein
MVGGLRWLDWHLARSASALRLFLFIPRLSFRRDRLWPAPTPPGFCWCACRCPLRPDAFQQHRGGLVVGVLLDQFAPKGFGEEGRCEVLVMGGRRPGAGFEAVCAGEERCDAANDLVLLSEGRNRKNQCTTLRQRGYLFDRLHLIILLKISDVPTPAQSRWWIQLEKID